MTILAIDPGTSHSGVVVLSGRAVVFADADVENSEVSKLIRGTTAPLMAIEMAQCMGMPAGAELLETVWWTGRFSEIRLPKALVRIRRSEVKMHLCGNSRARDPNIRQALVDMWGGKSAAIGTAKQRGPLYGVKSHAWAALAVAVTARDGLPLRRAA